MDFTRKPKLKKAALEMRRSLSEDELRRQAKFLSSMAHTKKTTVDNLTTVQLDWLDKPEAKYIARELAKGSLA